MWASYMSPACGCEKSSRNSLMTFVPMATHSCQHMRQTFSATCVPRALLIGGRSRRAATRPQRQHRTWSPLTGSAGAAAVFSNSDQSAFRGAVIVAGALTLGEDGTGRELPFYLRSEVAREAIVSATVTNPYLTRALFSRFVHRSDAITDEDVRQVQYPLVRRGTTDTIARWLPTLLLPPRGAASTKSELYATLDLPVALIWGRQDSVTPPEHALALQAALGDAPITWLDDVGHIPQIEAPEVFHDALIEALARIAGNT